MLSKWDSSVHMVKSEIFKIIIYNYKVYILICHGGLNFDIRQSQAK